MGRKVASICVCVCNLCLCVIITPLKCLQLDLVDLSHFLVIQFLSARRAISKTLIIIIVITIN